MATGTDTSKTLFVAKVAELAAWDAVARQIDAALRAGGESGLELLLNTIPEWGEAVEQANLALDVCWSLADRGLRDEALQWHAPGFLAAVRRLHPDDRPGWDAWEQALVDREIDVPRLDTDTLEMIEALVDELKLQDISGVSLEEHLITLRKNTLARGHLGERLMTLESLQAMDSGKPVWEDMIRPIMQLRARAIGDELEAAIAQRDFRRIQALSAEAKTPSLAAVLPGHVGVMLRGARYWAAAPAEVAELERATALCAEQSRRLKELRVGAVDHESAIQACDAAIQTWREHKKTVQKIAREVEAVPRLQDELSSLQVKDLIARTERTVREAERILGEHKQWERLRSKFFNVEQTCDRLRRKAPDRSMGWEAFKSAARSWTAEADDALMQSRQLCSQVADAIPEATEIASQQLGEARQQVKDMLDRTKRSEAILIGVVISGVVGVSLLLVGVLIASAIFTSAVLM